ncbi:MAG TPA: hypothetical protein VMH35_20570 [Streptosporangiaceae bacterium]|nr:hypothetical protein [Streptosporangiaceae bacterium]
MRHKHLELSAVQVIAGVLAALTGALAAAYLGVAGTIIGVAVVSLASSVGTAVYRYFLGRTRDRLRLAAASVSTRARRPGDRAGARPAGRGTGSAAPLTLLAGLHEATPDRPGSQHADRDARARAGGRWLELIAAVATTFVLTMTLITGIELAARKPLDAILWHRPDTGTSISHVIHPPAQSPGRSAASTHRHRPATPGPTRPAANARSRKPSAAPKTTPAPTPTASPPAVTPSPSRSPSPSADPTSVAPPRRR